MDTFQAFMERKSQLGEGSGFEPLWMPDFLFDFQKSLVSHAIKMGRFALFEDCGLGKTIQELVYAQNIVQHTNHNVLLLAPLAVTAQTIREGAKFGIECKRSHDGTAHKGITVTNYEQLHKFNASDFSGVVCDESSILKNFSGARRGEITLFMRKIPYRLLGSATAAPNDYIELGTSSEALGDMGHIDMLHKYFVNEQNNISIGRHYGEAPKWRFKGHAEQKFWQWVCSWARAVRNPSDLGFDGSAFVLPELYEPDHFVDIEEAPEGCLFTVPATNIKEQRDERKRTLSRRCEKAADLVAQRGRVSMSWCHLNDEGDMLTRMIPGAVQISGKDSDGSKEEKLLAFVEGEIKHLVTKPKIGAWGLNCQHCDHITYFPSHSYEQYYQAVRRCWRFGQKNAVTVDRILTEGERLVMENLERKNRNAMCMFENLVADMHNSMAMHRINAFTETQEVPSWL